MFVSYKGFGQPPQSPYPQGPLKGPLGLLEPAHKKKSKNPVCF